MSSSPVRVTTIAAFIVLLIIVGVAAYYAGLASAPKVVKTVAVTSTVISTTTHTITQTVTITQTLSPTPTTTPILTSTTAPTTSPTTATAVEFKGTVKIGALLPLNLPIGKLMLTAIKMAATEINARGGVLGYRIEVVPYDTEWKSDKAAEGYKYLAEQGVKVVIGPFGSHEALAILDLLPLYRVLVLAPGAVSDEVDKKVLGDYESYKYWFRVYVNATSQAAATWDLIAYIAHKFGYKKIAWIYEDLPWVIPHAQYGRIRSKQEGIEIVAAIGVKPNVQSFADAFKKAVDSGAEMIVWQFSGTEDYVFARDYYDLQVSLLAVGGGSFAMLENFYNQTQGKAEGLICIAWGFPANITPKTMEFYKKYKSIVGVEPLFTTWNAYDAVYIWAKAVEKAGSFDPEKVIPVLEKMTFVGTAGVYEFTKSHTAMLAPNRIYPIFFQWQKGKRVVVWPLRLVEPGTKLLVPQLKDGKRVWREAPWP